MPSIVSRSRSELLTIFLKHLVTTFFFHCVQSLFEKLQMEGESLGPNSLPKDYILISDGTVFPLRFRAIYIQSTE